MYDVIIIGGGPAGLSCALYARRGGLKVLVIEKLVYGGQMNLTGDIENYPGVARIAGYSLAENMRKGCADVGVEFLTAEVKSYELIGDVKKVYIEEQVYDCKSVVLAMGARPKTLGIESESKFIGSGVSYCAHCDGGFFRNLEVVVVGGGNTALTEALYLSNICKTVYLVHRRNKFRGRQILVERVLNKPNIKLVLESYVEKILGDNKVESVYVVNDKDGEINEIKCSGVFVSVGTIPNTENFVDGVSCDEKGFIDTEEYMETSIDGVYAIGDIRHKSLRQIVTAVADGAIAANNILEKLA